MECSPVYNVRIIISREQRPRPKPPCPPVCTCKAKPAEKSDCQ